MNKLREYQKKALDEMRVELDRKKLIFETPSFVGKTKTMDEVIRKNTIDGRRSVIVRSMDEKHYQFPRTIFVSRNSLWRQWWHLLSEVLEIGKGIWLSRKTPLDYNHIAREAWDVKHSAESLLRILEQKNGVDVIGLQGSVLVGNLERGYYE
jgi:hypothetical protein